MRRVALIIGVALVLACAFGLGRLSAPDASDPLPRNLRRCTDLAGLPVDDGVGPAGCMTTDGAALQGYRFECVNSSELPDAKGAVDAASYITFIPDAGLVGVSGKAWRHIGQPGLLAAYHRTPFTMLGTDECKWLRSVPSDWPARTRCDLDEVRIDLVSLQGCEFDGAYYAAVGRNCTYQSGDTGASWEQWWLVGSAGTNESAPPLETSGPPETWTLIDSTHRDDRCRVAPQDWPQEWRESL